MTGFNKFWFAGKIALLFMLAFMCVGMQAADFAYNDDGDSISIKDRKSREFLLDFTEQFRLAYNRGDMDFIATVFSDGGLIVTNHGIKSHPIGHDEHPSDRSLAKRKYLSVLKIYARSKPVNVAFDKITIERHPKHNKIYGLTLHQELIFDAYCIDGYVFIVWDFSNEQHQDIIFTEWQQDAGKIPCIGDL